jgi:hypothetical protein
MAKFCSNNLIDAETIGLVTNLLAKSKRIMPKLNYQDKWPNIDGYLYFLEKPSDNQDNNAETLGTFEVQIKKLPKNQNLRFSIKTDFLRYCKTSFNPVIFMGVDLSFKTIYWLHINSELIDDYQSKLSQNKLTITLDESKNITDSNFEYIDLWEKIIVEHRNRMIGYDRIKESLDSYTFISENSKLIPTKVNSNYVKIHIFLDTINNFIDGEFNVIKKIYLPFTWKLGFAFLDYKSTKLSYSLFNIPYNVNDVQIKQIIPKRNFLSLMQKQNIDNFFVSPSNNEIEKKPEIVAIRWIEKKLKEIIKNKFLYISSIEIVNEYLYEFIVHYHREFGLPCKNDFTLEEINNALNEHLLLWIEEFYKLKKIPLRFVISIDLDSIFTTKNEAVIIEENVQSRIRDGKFSKSKFIFTNKKYDFSKFIRFLEIAKNKNIVSIKKIYYNGNKDLTSKQSYFIWEKWAREELVYNTKLLYSILPYVYDEIIRENFNKIYEDLKFFKGFNKYVVVLSGAKDNYSHDVKDRPYIKIYEAINNSSYENNIEVYDESEFPYEEDLGHLKLNKKTTTEHYDLIKCCMHFCNNIFHEFPLLSTAYNLLECRLNEYIEELKKPEL